MFTRLLKVFKEDRILVLYQILAFLNCYSILVAQLIIVPSTLFAFCLHMLFLITWSVLTFRFLSVQVYFSNRQFFDQLHSVRTTLDEHSKVEQTMLLFIPNFRSCCTKRELEGNSFVHKLQLVLLPLGFLIVLTGNFFGALGAWLWGY